MAERQLSNWLDSYMEYTEDTEPAKVFHRWIAMSVIAGALRKKVFAKYGRLRYYPNLYVILVAEPGICRKSQAISYGVDIMTQVPEILTSADAVTKEALLQDLEGAAVEDQLLDGTLLRHSSLSIISREFESFIGQKKDNTKMLVLLTDLFDAQELPWKYRTKNSGNNVIPSIFLNLLGATTPDSLASCLPSTAIGGGFTSRVLFVWADKKAKKVAKPEDSPRIQALRDKLIKDLYLISRIVGQYNFSPEADRNWKEWYDNYDETDKGRLCVDPAFNGWYSRKPAYLIKVAIICAAAESNRLVLEWRHIEQSFREIAAIEAQMGVVFKAIGKSTVTSEVDMVMQIIKSRKVISETDLMSMVWRDIDDTKFNNVIQTAIRTGKVKRGYRGPKGEGGGIWYYDSTFLTKKS